MHPRWIERIIFSLALGIGIVFGGCLYDCNVRAQDATNISPYARMAQLPIPPIPKITHTHLTNSEGEVVTVTVRKPPDLPPLVRKSWTNAFWVACTECDLEAIRKPVRIDLITSSPIEDGEQREYAIYFRCCGQEFKSRYVRRVTTPIAVPVQVPSK